MRVVNGDSARSAVNFSGRRSERLKLIEFLVHPEFRRRGLGRLLLEHLLAWAKARGATRAQLLADNNNLSAELFYNALGWQTTQLGVRRRFIQQ